MCKTATTTNFGQFGGAESANFLQFGGAESANFGQFGAAETTDFGQFGAAETAEFGQFWGTETTNFGQFGAAEMAELVRCNSKLNQVYGGQHMIQNACNYQTLCWIGDNAWSPTMFLLVGQLYPAWCCTNPGLLPYISV